MPKVHLNSSVSTTPNELLHIDFTSIKMTMEPNRPPKVVNVLVFQDHCYGVCASEQTAKTVSKFLYQDYISIFGALVRLLSNHGVNFMSSIIGKTCKLISVKKL